LLGICLYPTEANEVSGGQKSAGAYTKADFCEISQEISFSDISQNRILECSDAILQVRFEDFAPCRSPPPATGIFEATSLAASRGFPERGEVPNSGPKTERPVGLQKLR